MNSIAQLKIGDLFKISKGKKSEEVSDSELRYIQIKDLRNDDNLKFAKSDKKNVVCNKSDILIAWDGANAGTIGYDLEGVIGSTLAKLVPQSKEVDSHYAGRFLQSKFKYLRDNCTGATIPHISKPSLVNLNIPLFPLAEQKKIAEILDAADSLRRKDQQLIEHYTALSQSLFLEMFGDPVTNPMGWDVIPLEAIADIVSGVTKGRKLKIADVFEIPYMRVANVQAGHLNLDEIKTIPGTEADILKFVLKKGDILLTEGGDPDKLGRGTVWNEEIENCIHQNHIFRVRLTCDQSTPVYLSRLCGSEYGKRYFMKSGKQTTGIASINKTQLKKFPVLQPPINLQTQFAKNIQEIEHQKHQAQANLKNSEALFNSLLQRAFKGELTSSEAA